MNDDFELLSLQSPVGKGQENNPDDIEAIDARLRKINAYSPSPEYADNPQRYATEPMIGALERYQERNGLKIDGVANPGGPTERAINNHLLEKPRGAGLLYDPPSPLAGTVGNGFENRPKDVASVQRRLGALNYLPEDPFDRPHGFIDEATTNGIKAFQHAKGLTEDGWLAPRGETERALDNAVSDLARAKGREWFAYAERTGRAQQAWLTRFGKLRDGDPAAASDAEGAEADGIIPVRAPPGTTFTPPSAPPLAMPGGRLIEINPQFIRPNLPDIRKHLPMPRDLQWSNPGELPNAPNYPKIRLGPPTHDEDPLSINDIPRALGLPPHPSLDEEVKRALPIAPPRTEPQTYIPEPGSPLRIPIIDSNPDGRPGKRETVRTTEDAIDAIKKECEEVLRGTGAKFGRTLEHYYSPRDGEPGQRRDTSYADGLVRITIGKITIDFVADTYTPTVTADPIGAENARFMKLERNMSREHGIVIRVPKGWALGQEIDKEKLSEATREICEQIKNMLERGDLAADKEKIFIKRLLNHLVKPKPKRGPDPQKPREPRE